jgi:adenylate cyclase
MLNEWDWNNSEKEFRIGIELNPNYATGRHWYSQWLLYKGDFGQALREITFAVYLDPVSQGILKDKGMHLYYNRQYDEAINMAMKTLDLDPNFVPVHRLLSLAYQGKGMFDRAITENQIWGELTGNKVKTDVALAQIYAAGGRNEAARKIVEHIEVRHLSGNDYRGMSLAYTALGEHNEAFAWLEKSYEMHEESLCNLKVDPKLDPLRPDQRFNSLLKKVGL